MIKLGPIPVITGLNDDVPWIVGNATNLTGNPGENRILTFYIKDNIVFILFGIICSSPIIPFVKSKLKDTNFILEILSAIIIVLLFIISISYLIKGTYNPFIYFNF